MNAHRQTERGRLSAWCDVDTTRFGLTAGVTLDQEEPEVDVYVRLGPLVVGVRLDLRKER